MLLTVSTFVCFWIMNVSILPEAFQYQNFKNRNKCESLFCTGTCTCTVCSTESCWTLLACQLQPPVQSPFKNKTHFLAPSAGILPVPYKHDSQEVTRGHLRLNGTCASVRLFAERLHEERKETGRHAYS